MKRILFTLSFLLFLVMTIQNVYAVDIDITEFDDRIGDALGVGAFGGGLILSTFFLFLFLALMGMVMRRAPSFIMTMVMSCCVLSMCIAFGWFPVWTLIVIVFVIALLFSTKAQGVFR